MKRWLISSFFLIFVTSCTNPPVSKQPQDFTAEASIPIATSAVAQNELPQVVSVGDGDTLRVQRGNKTITIRLSCIDAPEFAQVPWGLQSANRLKQLLPTGQAIQMREIERDRYGRTVAELYLGNQSVNLQMVKEGQAVVYQQYIENCSETKDQYFQAEAQAKGQRLGFWNQSNPVMPWDYRKGKRTSSAGSRSAPASNCSPAYPDVCIPPAPPDLNCKDITYRNFRVLPPEPHNFDNDKDGIGCESKKHNQ